MAPAKTKKQRAARRGQLEVSEEQILYFRACREHLAGPGADDAVAAARAILGAQAQQLSSALLALSARTRGRPTAAALKEMLLTAEPRPLVRTWGQRDTLHLFDAASDWSLVVAARATWGMGGRRGAMPPPRDVARAHRALTASADGVITRGELMPLVSAAFLREAEEKMGERGDGARRFAAGRLLWRLALQGDCFIAGKRGAENEYAARASWYRDLAWPEDLEPGAAALALARRYLSAYGPATAADLAHFFGAKAGPARGWLDALAAADELSPVRCGDRPGLVALAEDSFDLTAAPPKGAAAWPVRLLPMWDAKLMGHADKSWLVPDPGERPLVWRQAAVVAPVVLARGRIVATWTHQVKAHRIVLTVTPLSRWRQSRHGAGVRREASAVARHLGLASAEVTVV